MLRSVPHCDKMANDERVTCFYVEIAYQLPLAIHKLE